MPNTYLRSKIEERASQTAVLKSLQDKAATDGRDLTDAERKTFDEIVERLKDLDEQIERLSSFNAASAKFLELVGASSQAEEQAEPGQGEGRAW